MTTHFRRIYFLIFLSFALGNLWAQSGLQIQFQPQEITSQFYQPAFLQLHTMKTVSLGVGAEYGVGSNTLSVNRLYMDDSFITPDEKDALVGQMSDDNRLRLGFNQMALVNLEVKKQRISISWRDFQGGYFRVNNPATAGLILYGNAPYAGQTVNDDHITLHNFRFREIGIGSAWKVGDFSLGLRLKALIGSSGNFTDDLSYSLFTAADGTDIELNSRYRIFNGSGGAGLSADMGIVWQPNSTLILQAAVRDLGFITWNGTLRENEVNVSYQGFDLNNWIDTDFSSGGQLFTPDTLEELFFPDSTTGTSRVNLPGTFSVAGSWEFSSGKTISASLNSGFSQYAAWTPLPLINVSYAHQLWKPLTLGVNVFAGGMEGYGYGAFARANITLAEKYNASLFFSADNASGLVVPEAARGFSFQGGISLKLLPEPVVSALPAQ
ncbi:MAG: DUF5723 family protein [Bacteroidia bacterium]|nr:DUF5723 family protein [Bacteroidia bacterium]